MGEPPQKQQPQTPDRIMNDMVRAYAKEKGCTPAEALLDFEQHFVHKDVVVHNAKYPSEATAPSGSGSIVLHEQALVEMKKLEIQARKLELEEKKALQEERKIELQEKKQDNEAQLARDKLDREEKRNEAQLAIDRERAGLERTMLLMSMTSGKKGAPDEMLELLKLQANNTSEFYKSMLSSKDSEKDRDMMWRKELAKIESDREIEIEKLKSRDPEVGNSTQILIETLGEKFDMLGAQLANNPTGNFIDQISQHNKMQAELVKAAMPMLKAQGLSDDQLNLVKKQVGLEEERQTSTLDKIINAFKQIGNAIPQPNPPPQQQTVVPKEVEENIRRETEEKARQLKEQNDKLQLQLEEEKKRLQKWQEERSILEENANRLQLYYNNDTTNEQLFQMIEYQEAMVERDRQAIIAAQKAAAAQEERERPIPAKVPESAEPIEELDFDNTSPETKQFIAKVQEAVIVENPTLQKSKPPEEHPYEKAASEQIPDEESSDELIHEPFKEHPKQEPEPEKPALVISTPRTRSGKLKKVFIVENDQGRAIEVDAANHRGAAVSTAIDFGGTIENPVNVKVTDYVSKIEKKYKTYHVIRQSSLGKEFKSPRVVTV